jgi:hypothetical protein
MQEHRAEFLRRRVALYRRYLREGINGELAIEYLRQIVEDEAELGRIEPSERYSSANREAPQARLGPG